MKLLWIALLSAVTAGLLGTPRTMAAESLRVMSFNLWHGGEAGGQPLSQTAKVIQSARADIVGLQETSGNEADGKWPDNARVLADQLGWNYARQGDGISVITRFRIVDETPHKFGICIELPSEKRVWMFNVHLAHAPYQPYQLLKIPYFNGRFIDRADQAIEEARTARGEEISALMVELQDVQKANPPIFITGDFNEPSALDWTDAAVRADLCPIAVRWPTTGAILEAGFKDTFREVHPDPVSKPGHTWTPITKDSDPQDHHDRIDFVFAGGNLSRFVSAEIIGENNERADIVVAPYPSDHRSVVSEIELP